MCLVQTTLAVLTLNKQWRQSLFHRSCDYVDMINAATLLRSALCPQTAETAHGLHPSQKDQKRRPFHFWTILSNWFMAIIVCTSIYSVHPCIQTFVTAVVTPGGGVIWEYEYSQVVWDKSMFGSEKQLCLGFIMLLIWVLYSVPAGALIYLQQSWIYISFFSSIELK